MTFARNFRASAGQGEDENVERCPCFNLESVENSLSRSPWHPSHCLLQQEVGRGESRDESGTKMERKRERER